jgi:hypothetical protein
MSKKSIYSEEVEEIMNPMPSRILRYGTGGIFLFFILVISGMALIENRDTISTEVILITENPPARLVSKTNAKIEKLFVVDQGSVHEGQVIASLSSSAAFDQIQLIDKLLQDLNYLNPHLPLAILEQEKIQLGELHSDYLSFIHALRNYSEYQKNTFRPRKLELLNRQIVNQRAYFAELTKQAVVKAEEFGFVSARFKEDSTYYMEKKYGISKQEFNTLYQNYLREKVTFIGFKASLKNTFDNMITLEDTYLSTQDSFEREYDVLLEAVAQTADQLGNSIEVWKASYLFVAPIEGVITFTKYWSPNQVITSGEPIGTIVPHSSKVIGKLYIPFNAIGLAKSGQDVNIKLPGYSYFQYGAINGRIKSISLVPDHEGYAADIELISGMTSSYKKDVPFIQEMKGQCEIVLNKSPLIYKLFGLSRR